VFLHVDYLFSWYPVGGFDCAVFKKQTDLTIDFKNIRKE